MLTLNKYLRELGINENSWPFDEVKKNTIAKVKGQDYDERYIKDEMCDGFVDAECFDLSNTLAMIIYSYLCYFRDYCMGLSYPARFEFDGGEEKWRTIIDRIILSFKMYIEMEDKAPNILDYTDREEWKQDMKEYQDKIDYGFKLFIEFFNDLSW